MNLVLTMAGRNTRFHNIGFDIPKYLLPFKQGTVISEIINNISVGTNLKQIYFVAHERDYYFRKLLVKELSPLGVWPENIIYIGETKGQAQTGLIATYVLELPKFEPIFFHNADTIVYGRKLSSLVDKMMSSESEGIVDTFYSTHEHYSYVEIEDSYVKNVKEKKLISNFATSGLYGFKDVITFQESYLSTLKMQNFQDKEHFFSEVYSCMISMGKKVTHFHNIDGESVRKTLVLGTPAEYQNAMDAGIEI